MLQQGYLQFSNGDLSQRVFVILTESNISCYNADPSTSSQRTQPFSVFDNRLVKVADGAASMKKPKTFALIVSDSMQVEFSCPTNSIKYQWVKSILDAATKAHAMDAPDARINMKLFTSAVKGKETSDSRSHNRLNSSLGLGSSPLTTRLSKRIIGPSLGKFVNTMMKHCTSYVLIRKLMMFLLLLQTAHLTTRYQGEIHPSE